MWCSLQGGLNYCMFESILSSSSVMNLKNMYSFSYITVDVHTFSEGTCCSTVQQNTKPNKSKRLYDELQYGTLTRNAKQINTIRSNATQVHTMR